MQHAAFLSLETLKDALIEWYDNDQCRLASALPGLVVRMLDDYVYEHSQLVIGQRYRRGASKTLR